MLFKLLLLLGLLKYILTQCPNQYIFPSDCSFNIQYTDQACFNFNFRSCNYNGFLGKASSNDWQTCVSLCCDTDINYAQNVDSLKLCANFSTWNDTGMIMIIALVTFAFLVPSVVVIGWTCVSCYRRYQQIWWMILFLYK